MRYFACGIIRFYIVVVGDRSLFYKLSCIPIYIGLNHSTISFFIGFTYYIVVVIYSQEARYHSDGCVWNGLAGMFWSF